MNRPRPSLALAIALAALAGFVDAAGFVHFGGLFVSFMSGNSTQAAVALVGRDLALAGRFAATILLFVAGVAVGELVAAAAGRRCRPAVLGCECLLLAAAALAAGARLGDGVLAALLAFAMGVQNAVLHRAGAINVGLTYVTGTLVQVGRGIAGRLRGTAGWPLPFAGLWLGLAGGGLGGAMASAQLPLAAVLAAAGAMAAALFLVVAALPTVFVPEAR